GAFRGVNACWEWPLPASVLAAWLATLLRLRGARLRRGAAAPRGAPERGVKPAISLGWTPARLDAAPSGGMGAWGFSDSGAGVREVCVVGAARAAIGSFRGELASVPAPRLGGVAVAAALSRAGVSPGGVSGVLVGCVLPAGG